MAALTLRKGYGGRHWHRRGMRILQQSVGMPENTGRKNMVYELLKNQVLNLELKPGEMLSENSLAAQMHAGRPLVRDALAQLTEEGYVVVYPQRGTEVSLLSQSRIRQAVQTHIILEQAAIREICKKGLSREQHRQLADILKLQQESGSRESIMDFIVREQDFYHLIMAFCGKELVWDLFRRMECDLRRVDYLRYTTFNYQESMSSPSSAENSLVEGKLLLDNLRRGETEAACLVCSNHFNTILWSADTLRGFYPQYFTE